MMNILLDGLDFNKEWAYDTFKEIIKPGHRVIIVPFSFHEEWIKNAGEWEKSYNKFNGEHYSKIILPFLTYGISENNIKWINYFEDNIDSAKTKLINSDIIFFTGGLPDRIMNRLEKLDLVNIIEHHEGIIMGWSAGAMMQCLQYYISPDKDYSEFIYLRGLDCIKDFAVEVHYQNTEVQNKSIEKYMLETGKKVYTTKSEGAIIVDGNRITLLGNANIYQVCNENNTSCSY